MGDDTLCVTNQGGRDDQRIRQTERGFRPDGRGDARDLEVDREDHRTVRAAKVVQERLPSFRIALRVVAGALLGYGDGRNEPLDSTVMAQVEDPDVVSVLELAGVLGADEHARVTDGEGSTQPGASAGTGSPGSSTASGAGTRPGGSPGAPSE